MLLLLSCGEDGEGKKQKKFPPLPPLSKKFWRIIKQGMRSRSRGNFLQEREGIVRFEAKTERN